MVIEHIPNIRHMAAFVAVVEEGSLTRASRSVNLTQPALTQAIARLEAEIGCVLFDRTNAGMIATEPAHLLAPWAARALRRIGSGRVTGSQIRAFLAVVRSGSYPGGSDNSGLSPASLHRAIADLSIALGQRLVERRGRQLIVTEAGRRRQRDFGLALADLRNGFDEVSRWLGKKAGRIVIGAMPLSRANWLPATILRYARANPEVDLVIIEGSHAELVGPLRDGEIDLLLGALRDSPGSDDLNQRAVFEDRPKLIMRAGHPLSREETRLRSELVRYPWILPAAETPLRGYWNQMMRTLGHEPPHVSIECGSVLATRQLLVGSDAITLLSPEQLALEIDAGVLLALDPPVGVVRTIGITTREDWLPTVPQSAFISMLVDR